MFTDLTLSKCVTKSNRMAIHRYMLTTAILDENENLIPFWDKKLKFKPSESGDNFHKIEYDSVNYDRNNIVSCFYDLKTKKLMRVIDEIEIKDNKYNIGDSVLVRIPKHSSKIKRTKIVDVMFELDYVAIYSGREIYLKNYDKYREDILIDENLFYNVKYYIFKYKVEDGSVVTNYDIFTEVF